MAHEVFFISDTHWFHKRILDFCSDTRDAESIADMNEKMIDRWNAKISLHDEIYHLGDFSFGTREETESVLKRLKGRIHLIKGNHDKSLETRSNLLAYFNSVQDYKRLHIGDHRIVMMHFPIESWDKMKHGTIHLHGHLHGDDHHECKIIKNRMDVGVDCRPNGDLSPWEFSEILEYLKNRDSN